MTREHGTPSELGVPSCTCHNTGICTRCVLAGLKRDNWSKSQDALERECEAELANAHTTVDIEAGANALRRGDFAEWAFKTVCEHAARLRAGGSTDVIVLDEYRPKERHG